MKSLTFAAGVLLFCCQIVAQLPPVRLDVDATDAPRKILHARLHFPARPGELTLLYPKWIPGEHGPTGPITDLVGLQVLINGQNQPWRRDSEDMFSFHLTVPGGADAVEIALDFLLPPNSGSFSAGASATPNLLALNWNQVLLYPQGVAVADLRYVATLRLPAGWQFGTALPRHSESSAGIEFEPVSLETLIDSPVIAGSFFRTVDLTPHSGVPHALHLAADSAAALELKPEDTRHFSSLVAESAALFGAPHYRSYHFLLTLSDHVAHFGLEHHQSSDNREGEKYLINEDARKLGASLLPHEMVHSWNGKYRRPAGLATADYHRPMRGDLLWVYEGLTEYLGILLTARSGLWTNESFRENLAFEAASLDQAPGRSWRPLSDTAVAAQLLYDARDEGAAWRRGVDFYSEGDLIWLEADVLIRQETKGRRSLDDFCRKFFGGESTPPQVVSYTFADLVKALDELAPYPWRNFFNSRVYERNSRAPLRGIEGAGWRLAYTNEIPELLKLREDKNKCTDLSFSLGLKVKEDGYLLDVIPGSPADKAGAAPAMKLLAVNSRRWSPDILRAAIKAAQTNASPIELLVENEEFFKALKLGYHQGEKYPRLERDPVKPDLLAEILKPRARPN